MLFDGLGPFVSIESNNVIPPARIVLFDWPYQRYSIGSYRSILPVRISLFSPERFESGYEIEWKSVSGLFPFRVPACIDNLRRASQIIDANAFPESNGTGVADGNRSRVVIINRQMREIVSSGSQV